ncbi:MAG: hypothetical protein GPJ50_11440, partial [Candidatus Heimdallarchaeota archaeon]|nr:hypothetical protein [Candidatus Heimdallarchaeota archaeon]
NPDTDNDGLLDGWEVENGHDPLKWDNWVKLFGLYLLPVWVVIVVLPTIFHYRHKLSKYYSMILQKLKRKE